LVRGSWNGVFSVPLSGGIYSVENGWSQVELECSSGDT
jgi:hypothetical protein